MSHRTICTFDCIHQHMEIYIRFPFLNLICDWICSTTGRLSTAICRLCHGKFSPRSLRHAFNKWSQDSISIVDDEPDAAAQSPLLFHTDFQRLVGVQLNRDPRLSEFICKKCHAKFYKCHSILIRFLQRVNLPPVGKENLKIRLGQEKCHLVLIH